MTAFVPQKAPQPQGRGFFTAIRQGFALVAARARHVRIRYDRLGDYARLLPDAPPRNVFDMKHHYISNDAEALAAYVLTLDAVNFGSGYEADLVREGWKMIDHSIYFTLASCLKHHFATQGPFEAQALAQITPEDCAGLFALPSGNAGREFSGLLSESLREMGAMIARDCNGRFLDFVEAANGSAETLAANLARLPHFQDVHLYDGLTVPFYKRAQITAADLHLAFGHLGRALFSDIGDVTMFPDNGVPHVLHVAGILGYSGDLSARIARGDEIPSGSAEEVEIRACVGLVVENIAALKNMRAMDIDHILWHRSVENALYRTLPTHRTRSSFY